MTMIADTAGVLLAGGKSSRFGSNKALTAFQGKPLISHASRLLASLFSETLLVTNTPETYDFLGWPMTADIYPGAGPLAGIHAALKKVASPKIFVIGCDMPLVEEKLVRLLCRESKGWDAVVPELTKGLEPLCAVYSQTCLAIIEKNLNNGHRKLHRLFDQIRTNKIPEDIVQTADHDLVSFKNINKRADLEAITSLLQA